MHTQRMLLRVSVGVGLALLASACASGSEAASGTGATVVAEGGSTTSGAPASMVTPAGPSSSGSTTVASSTTTAAATIVNRWSSAPVDATRLPLGDAGLSTAAPAVGATFACAPGNPNAPGARADGPWLDRAANTWDATAKLAVEGEILWPDAAYTEQVTGEGRVLTTNGRPTAIPTGRFPIAATDPAYQYDRNPGTVGAQNRSMTLPAAPVAASAPACLPFGAIGVLRNGVILFNAVDARGDDAVAHEVQDRCDGHPAMQTYHYHSVTGCLLDAATGPSTVVGFALDGFPIVVERDVSGRLPANGDLDECHGRTSPILLDGAVVTTYHYSATLEYPYALGCFRGTPITVR